eukprot:245162_1
MGSSRWQEFGHPKLCAIILVMVKNVSYFNIFNGQNHWVIIIKYVPVIEMFRNGHLVILMQFYMVSMVIRWLFSELLVMYPVIAALHIKEQLLKVHVATVKEYMVSAKGEAHIGEGIVSCKG